MRSARPEQFFGTLRVEAKTKALTVRLHNANGDVLFTVDLPPQLS